MIVSLLAASYPVTTCPSNVSPSTEIDIWVYVNWATTSLPEFFKFVTCVGRLEKLIPNGTTTGAINNPVNNLNFI